MATVQIIESEHPDDAEPLVGDFELPRVPVTGEAIEFASNVQTQGKRIMTEVQRVEFTQGDEPDADFAVTVIVKRETPPEEATT